MAKKISRGLGDTIANITSAIGIEPCESCDKRKEFLNKVFPYKTKELTEDDYKKLILFKDENQYLKRLVYSEVYFNLKGKSLPIEGADDLWRDYELFFNEIIKEYEKINSIK